MRVAIVVGTALILSILFFATKWLTEGRTQVVEEATTSGRRVGAAEVSSASPANLVAGEPAGANPPNEVDTVPSTAERSSRIVSEELKSSIDDERPGESESVRDVAREELAVRHFEREVPSEGRASTAVELSGTIELWEDAGDAQPLPASSGYFDVTIVKDTEPIVQRVPVQDGVFTTIVPPDCELELLTFELDGATAWIRGDVRRRVTNGGRLDLAAVRLSARTLRIVDAVSGEDVRGVSVFAARTPCEHPGGALRTSDLLCFERDSPFEVRPFVARSDGRDQVALEGFVWVNALDPGRASEFVDWTWMRVRVDFDRGRGEERIPLPRGGALIVRLDLEGESSTADLWIEIVGESRPDEPLFRHSAAFHRPMGFRGLRTGSHTIRVIQGDGNPRPVLAQEEVVIRSDREATVRMKVSPPPFPVPEVEVRGTIEFSESWGRLFGALNLSRSGSEESVRFETATLPKVRSHPRTIAFSATLRPGEWTMSPSSLVPSFHWVFDVESRGEGNLRFTLGEPAPVSVRWKGVDVDEQDLRRALHWIPSASVDESSIDAHFTWSRNRVKGFTARAGLTTIFVDGSKLNAPVELRRLLVAEDNELEITLEPPVGISATFTEDGDPFWPAYDEASLRLRGLDGGTLVDATSYDYFVSKPGRYELTIETSPEFEPVAPMELGLERGALKEVAIPLRRIH